MKLQPLFNLFIFLWMVVISIWMVVLSIAVMSGGVPLPFQESAVGRKGAGLDTILSGLMQGEAVSPELQSMMNDLMQMNSQNDRQQTAVDEPKRTQK